jgi:hypothetical protein
MLHQFPTMLQIPIDLLRTLIPFLDVKSLVRLHTSCCNKVDRNRLQAVFDQLRITNIVVNDHSLIWYENRNININHATTLYLDGWTELTSNYLLAREKSLSLKELEKDGAIKSLSLKNCRDEGTTTVLNLKLLQFLTKLRFVDDISRLDNIDLLEDLVNKFEFLKVLVINDFILSYPSNYRVMQVEFNKKK